MAYDQIEAIPQNISAVADGLSHEIQFSPEFNDRLMTVTDFWLLFDTDFLYLAAAPRCNFCDLRTSPACIIRSADTRSKKTITK